MFLLYCILVSEIFTFNAPIRAVKGQSIYLKNRVQKYKRSEKIFQFPI